MVSRKPHPDELRERAVKLVFEVRAETGNEGGSIARVRPPVRHQYRDSPELGCAASARRLPYVAGRLICGAVRKMGNCWLPGVALRGEASGRLMLGWLKTVVVSDRGKGPGNRGQAGTGKASVSEPLMKCRDE
jgi:hypothetical protein